MPFPFYQKSKSSHEDLSPLTNVSGDFSTQGQSPTRRVPDSEDDLSQVSRSNSSSSVTPASPSPRSPASTDPEHSARLLLLYIKSYSAHLVNKTLCLNPATLRYIAARIREMKRAPPNARFSILDFFRSSEELSYYDFVQIENSFKELRKIAILGKNEVTELDLRYFLNLNSLRISKCDVVYVSEPDEWFVYQMHRLQDVRIIRGKMALSSMRSVPYKLKVVESILAWDSLSEKWIRLLQDIECIRCKLGQLASLLVPQIAMKVISTEDSTNGQTTTDDESTDHSSGHSVTTVGWQDLTRLTVIQNNIRHLDQSLTFCPNLEYLDLRNNQIENLDASMITRSLTKLDTVILRNNFLDSLQLSRNLLEHVRLLDISHNHLTTIAGIECAVRLKELDVSHNSLIDWNDVKRLKKLPLLQKLDLHHNPDLEQHEEYRGLIAGMFVGRSQGFVLDGKPVSRWEAKSNATLASSSSDSEDDVASARQTSMLKVSTTTQQTDWAQAVLTPVLITPATPISAKKLKKTRKRVRKVTEIPEFTAKPKVPAAVTGEDTPETADNVEGGVPKLQVTAPSLNTAAVTTPSSSMVQNSEEFFKHMSHFYESGESREDEDGKDDTDSGESNIRSSQTSSTTNTVDSLSKDVEWTKEHLSTIREDAGDNWLLLLNEYMHPEQKRQRKMLQKRAKRNSTPSDALTSGIAPLSSTIDSLSGASSNNIVSDYKTSDFSTSVRSDPAMSSIDRVPSFRRPVAATKIIVDYSNALAEDLVVQSNTSRLTRRFTKNILYCTDAERIERETFEFLKELNLENEIGLGPTHEMNSDQDSVGAGDVVSHPNPETSLSLSEMISDTSSIEDVDAQDSNKPLDTISEQSAEENRQQHRSLHVPEPSLDAASSGASDDNNSIFEETASDSSDEELEPDTVENSELDDEQHSEHMHAFPTPATPMSALSEDIRRDSIAENYIPEDDLITADEETSHPTPPASITGEEPEHPHEQDAMTASLLEPVQYSSSHAIVTFSDDSGSESGSQQDDRESLPAEGEDPVISTVQSPQSVEQDDGNSSQDDETQRDTPPSDDEDTESHSLNARSSTTLERVIEESMKKTKLILAGYLHKEGGVWRSWKRRYFKLTEKYWIYGKDMNDTIDVIDTCHIQSVSCTVHRKGVKKYQKFGFIVDVGGEINRTYKLCAESEEEQMKWVRALTALTKGAQNGDRSAPSMLTATNSNCFRLKHSKSGLFMDVSSTGKVIFTRESSGNHLRWRYIGGRITNENLGTVLVAESDGTCRLMSLDKNPGSESFWKAVGQHVVNFSGQYLTISREWLQKNVNIVGFTQEKDRASVNQVFEVIQ